MIMALESAYDSADEVGEWRLGREPGSFAPESENSAMFTAEAWRNGAQLTTGLYRSLDEAQTAVQSLLDDGWIVLITTANGLPVMISAD